MLPEDAIEADDKDIVYRQYFDKMQCEFLKTLVCDEVVEEHKSKPLGQHSEALERLLHFFRCAPQKGKYAIQRNELSKTFKIIALSGARGTPPRTVEDKKYETIQDAYHGVFLRRVRDLMES